jgi:hypothetical protein
VRFACALALHAFEGATGLQRGPFDQPRAERFARALLMPGEQSLPWSTRAMPRGPSGSACRSSRSRSGGPSSACRQTESALPLTDGPSESQVLALRVAAGGRGPSRACAREDPTEATNHERGVSMTDEITLLVAERDDQLHHELVGQTAGQRRPGARLPNLAETRCRAATARICCCLVTRRPDRGDAAAVRTSLRT